MGTLIVLFLCILIVPLTMLVFGVLMRRRPPKDMGGVFGYRTRRSTMNEETWKFAHEMCGKVWTLVGAVLLVVSVVLSLLFLRSGADVLMDRATSLSMAQVVILVLSIVPVEHSLKKHFDENGNPKE